MENAAYLIPIFFLIAVIYSSVGFGGASSYLAVMVIFSLSYHAMPKISLLCNIVVVSGVCVLFFRAGQLRLTRAVPLVIGSVPMAYLGGKVAIGKQYFLFLQDRFR